MDARLDVTTRAKVDDLAKHFHKPRASVVCHIMQWGLGRGQAETRDGGASEGPVRHLYLYVDTAWHQRVEKAASAGSGSPNRDCASPKRLIMRYADNS